MVTKILEAESTLEMNRSSILAGKSELFVTAIDSCLLDPTVTVPKSSTDGETLMTDEHSRETHEITRRRRLGLVLLAERAEDDPAIDEAE